MPRALVFDDEFIYGEIALPLAERKIPAIRIANESADLAFSEWANSPDKIRY